MPQQRLGGDRRRLIAIIAALAERMALNLAAMVEHGRHAPYFGFYFLASSRGHQHHRGDAHLIRRERRPFTSDAIMNYAATRSLG